MPNSASSNPKYIAVLALISLALLLVGATFRPGQRTAKQARNPAETTLLQTEIARLQRLTKQNSYQSLAGEQAAAAREAARHLLRLPGLDRTAIVWGAQRMLLTAKPENTPPDEIQPQWGGKSFAARITLWPPGVPVGAALLSGDAPPPVLVAVPASLHSGDWMVAVALQEDGAAFFLPATYSATVPDACGDFHFRAIHNGATLGPALLGGGIFDLQGRLAGLITRCDNRYVAVAVADIVQAVDHLDRPADRLRNRYGIEVTELDSAAKAYLHADGGVLVKSVWRDWPGERAGLLPGDVIASLNGNAIGGLAALSLAGDDKPLRLGVLRNRVRKTVSLSNEATPSDDAGLHLRPAAGITVDVVDPGSPAARAGVQAGDRILLANGRPVISAPAILRALASAGTPMSLVLDRRQQLTFALVQR